MDFFYKVYDYQYFCLEKDMYYDFFHFLRQEIYYEVSIAVKTDCSLKCVQESTVFPSITSNNPIILNF